MSLAEELLATTSDNDGISLQLADVETEPHIVIADDRFITVPDELKRIAVQYDHRAETVTFDCPRYWDGQDMSKMKVYVNYTRADGLLGMYIAENITVDKELPNIMHFDWTLTRNVTGIDGPIVFLVCVKKTDKNGYEVIHWNSERNTEMYVSTGLEGEEAVQNLYPDVFTQMLERMDEIEELTEETKEYVDNVHEQFKKELSDTETRVNNRAEELESYCDASEARVNARADKLESNFNDAVSKINNRASAVEARMTATENKIDEIKEIATPEAMQNYTNTYITEHHELIDQAIENIAFASDTDIDNIIGDTYVDTPDTEPTDPGGGSSGGGSGCECEEIEWADDTTIDTIIDGSYVETTDEPSGGGSGSGGSSDPVTDEEIDNIVDNLF